MIAGLNSITHKAPRWLNVLGWALPIMVIADVFKTALSWMALFCWPANATSEGVCFYVVTALLALLGAAKWLGFAGVVALVGLSMPKHLQK